MKILKDGHNYIIEKNDGTSITLTCIEADLLTTFIRKENLRYMIDDEVTEAEEDWLDLSKYEGTRDEFIQEIFEALEDEIDYGNSVSVDSVQDQISDLATFYGLEKE